MTPRPGTLGVNQLAWLRAKVPAFADAERKAIAARVASEEQREKVMHEREREAEYG